MSFVKSNISEQLIVHPHKYFNRRSLLPLYRDSYWEIQSGVVRTFTILENGTIVTFGLWGKDDLVSAMFSQADPFYMECLTAVEAKFIRIDDYEPMKTAFIEHIQQLNSLIEIKHSRPTDEALLKFLVWLGTKFGREIEGGHVVDLRLTHQEISEILGITRVTVTKMFKILEERQVIKRFGQQSIIIYEPTWYYQI